MVNCGIPTLRTSPAPGMSLSHSEIASVLHVLATDLPGATCQAVRAVRGRPHTLLLKLRAPGATHLLLLSAEGGASRIHRVDAAPPQPERPPAFVMLLRKWLHGARLLALALHDDDRVVRLVFERGPLDGSAHALHLVAELTGRHGNLFLLDPDDLLLGALHPDASSARTLAVGRPYAAPPPPERLRDGVRPAFPLGAPEPFLAEAYAEHLLDAGLTDAKRALTHVLRAAAKRVRKRAAALAKDQQRDPETYKRRADLLQQAWGRVERGATAVDVVDLYDPAQPTITLPLDPTLDLRENIERCYKRYKRFARGAVTVARRAQETTATLERLEGLLSELHAAEELDAVRAIEARVRREPDVPTPRAAARRAKPTERKPYFLFPSSDGIEILVGRTSRDNDALTFHVARGNDLWLHAADVPGSHVIVRTPRSQPLPRTTLEEAALLAAHYSKGKNDGVVTVRYTERKHLRKPKGAGAGRVSLAGGKTLDVRMDDPRLSELFARRSVI